MDNFIRPDIFNDNVQAFFTDRIIGADTKKLSLILSIKEDDIFLPRQKHTDVVHIIESDRNPKIADAVVTKRKGILIGVQVADCVPILLFDRGRSVAGAVHAGWRGTAAQIIKKTVQAMCESFSSRAEDICVALGPRIRQCCYYVGKEVVEAVHRTTGDGNYYREEDDGRCVLDLSSANMLQIMSMGIPEKNIWISDECTSCIPDRYYSYRVSKVYNGSQGGFIGIL